MYLHLKNTLQVESVSHPSFGKLGQRLHWNNLHIILDLFAGIDPNQKVQKERDDLKLENHKIQMNNQ